RVGATSPGASLLSETRSAYGRSGPTPRPDRAALAPGFGLTGEILADQHSRSRARLGRLLAALAFNPRPIGVGLDENTAAVIDPADRIEVIGTGAITIVDPSEMEFSSMDSAHKRAPVSVLGIRLHVLTEGCSYDIPTRTARCGPELA
ncbi:MAG: cyanophycinase, partial [Planctomycetes bacterium]|nr:cyanophycinase [Planctomycetota bacterium]